MIYVKFHRQVKGFAYGAGAEAFVADSPKLQAAINAGYVTQLMKAEETENEEGKKRGRPPKAKMNVHTR